MRKKLDIKYYRVKQSQNYTLKYFSLFSVIYLFMFMSSLLYLFVSGDQINYKFVPGMSRKGFFCMKLQ